MLVAVDEPRIKAGTTGEILVKPRSLFEAEVLINIHIREKGELRAKIEKLERVAREAKGLLDANAALIRRVKELEAKGNLTAR